MATLACGYPEAIEDCKRLELAPGNGIQCEEVCAGGAVMCDCKMCVDYLLALHIIRPTSSFLIIAQEM